MSDPSEQGDRPEREPGNRGVEEDVQQSGAGARSVSSTPPIADDAVHEQTQTPAPADDVGVPPDDEMGRDDSDSDET
jgi:hypothetical protein